MQALSYFREKVFLAGAMGKSQEYLNIKGKKVALVHDFLVCRGGAERVLRVLADMFPQAPIYTLLYDEEKMRGLFRDREIRTSFIQKFPRFLRKRYRFLLPFFPVAIETLDVRNFDLIISSSGAWSKGIVTRLNTKHIAYIHSPMRYVWDYHNQYLQEVNGSRLHFAKRLFLSYLRVWDREAADRPDMLIANSLYTQSRISKYYRRESSVIYPPCITDKGVNHEKNQDGEDSLLHSERYFLTVARLTASKKIHHIVDAFNKLGLPLLVVGEGPEEKELKKMAESNVQFLGWKNDDEMEKIYSQARAFVFAAEEDFGMAMVEAMSYGVPVIAYGTGGVREIVEEGKTGEFFASQSPAMVADGVRRFLENEERYHKGIIRDKACNFSRERFERDFMEYIEQ